jgi:uncharacterized surface protein with fasciclin (FAS1) repeats
MIRKAKILFVLSVLIIGTAGNTACQDTRTGGNGGSSTDIIDTATAAQQFETLLTALAAAELVSVLKADRSFTLLAPTDEAFSKLPDGDLEGLLKPENKNELRAIMTYHIIPGELVAEELAKLVAVDTVNGQKLSIYGSDDRLAVNHARVIATDRMARNGVVHVIDTVLLPGRLDVRFPDIDW